MLLVAVAVGVMVYLLRAPNLDLADAVIEALAAVVAVVVSGAGGRYLSRLRRRKTGSKTDIRTNLLVGLGYGITFGLVVGLVVGSVVGLVGAFGERPPQHLSRPRWSKNDILINPVVGLVTALMAGLMYGLVASNGLGSGLVVGLVAGLMVGIALVIGRPSTEAMCPIDPRSSWHWNRQFGLVVGLMTALAYGLGEALAYGLGVGLVVGLVESLAVGIAVGLVFPATWQVTLASAQLRRRGEAPVRLLRFLEDARDRQVLRTVGQIYQFRHSRLQDRLATPGRRWR